ncbi:MAG: glutamine-hydrolyzing GMP synthase [Saprospiraceae bacterium]|nr:glutamine-hydrolyzing GMP synthase [Saprospiraceae bacterium]
MELKRIVILDFGSQLTQLIARRVRELNYFCEVIPFHKAEELTPENCSAVILSGSPASVRSENHPAVDVNRLIELFPILGICYGAQLVASLTGGFVENSGHREYGFARLNQIKDDPIWKDIPDHSQVWMSHSDTIQSIGPEFELIGSSDSISIAAYRKANGANPCYLVQFHPEVVHSEFGSQFLKNFLQNLAKLEPDWTQESFIQMTVDDIRTRVEQEHVLLALSGGVDSTVAALLMHRAIGQNLHCFFIDNGLLRQGEYEQVLENYQEMGLSIRGIDAKDRFYAALKGLEDPELKRKAIGKTFIEVFEEAASSFPSVKWLCQGTIYPDVIESVSVTGPSVTIKSHHNVGGLPEKLKLKIIEPLRMLFKDEVRKVGKLLGLKSLILNRHPFPGPGLGIRIIGEITPDKVELLQKADKIFIDVLRENHLYHEIWQAGCILLPVKSVGVMGDERTYENVVALRAVSSSDGMTAEWSRIPHEILAKTSSEIINKVKGINRVVYDISSKPPATIEWE